MVCRGLFILSGRIVTGIQSREGFISLSTRVGERVSRKPLVGIRRQRHPHPAISSKAGHGVA